MLLINVITMIIMQTRACVLGHKSGAVAAVAAVRVHTRSARARAAYRYIIL